MVKYLFLLLLTCISLSAQNFGRLRGFVTDSTSGEALPYANVYLEDIQNGASTDERGLFLINQIPADLIYEVNISFVGYETKKVNVFIKPNSITELNVELAPQNYELNQIEKLILV
jgi:iron complex outermembrane receptor protein